ncbi:AraC family transcriptional regulator [Chiayiivirga flava]|uniref:AraC-like DNA-binding protein n=1 Tax=Chiayiivirga flava TaxID=659595 RepID=A0A7W8D4W3_9GAMM|nr:helix-turn-helix domain-containing protein [Chiayiivirga flava]MBB5207597.1 AraC-like DNA-binding protein [Chiayiivirga flava]
MESLALALIGFSLGAAALLLVAQFAVYRAAELRWTTRAAGALLLSGLAALQAAHGAELLADAVPALLQRTDYLALLFIVAAAFHLFFHGALQPAAASPAWLLWFAPALAVPWLDPRVALPLSFAFGAGFALRLAQLVYRLRAQRRRFALELVAFAAFAAMAVLVLALGLLAPLIAPRAFVLAYSILIGLSLWLALLVLLRYPDVAGRAADAVRAAYAVSTLTRVDRTQALERLRRAMDEDRLYTDENLSLASLAAALDLTPHQLSELINTGLGIGFSRYLREQRVAAAQRMLREEPHASVLSVGLAVGFTSQSNFYVAFREITGEVPGRYRKQALRGDT